ncbi:hypothetical protein IW147_002364 [Coemansia sp. RSA 720]|nr:hypothetical protein IW147_002364 [Coemansia sp. RSA 720]
MNNEFHYMYPPNQFGSMPMATPLAGYSTGGSTPGLMGATFDHHQQLPVMQQYANTPAFTKPSPAPASATTFSTRIIGDQNSIIYYRDEQDGSFNEHNVRQMVTADGTVYVEHIKGYSLVYVPNNRPIQQILGGVGLHKNGHALHGTLGKTISKKSSRMSREHSAKPSNKFIMYRSFKSKELRENNPDISQTEISCITASLWKNESEEVKERFQNEYLKLKQEYDLKENMMRPGGKKLGRMGSDDNTLSAPSENYKTGALNNHVLSNGNANEMLHSQDIKSAMFIPSDSSNMTNTPTYIQDNIAEYNMSSVQPFSVADISATEKDTTYVNQHATMEAGVDPSTLNSSDHSELTHPFMNTDINIMNDAQQLPIRSYLGDNIATSAPYSNFYDNDTRILPAEQASVTEASAAAYSAYVTEMDGFGQQ